MTNSDYFIISVIANDTELSNRVRGCLATLRAEAATPLTGRDAAKQSSQDRSDLGMWMWRIAATPEVLQPYKAAMSSEDSPGLNPNVISDAVILAAVSELVLTQ